MSDTGHVEDQVAAHALHALSPEEEARVDQHVAICSSCRHALQEAVDTAHLLALAAQPVRPPRHCKARVMELIEREQFLQRSARKRFQTPAWTRWAVAGALGLALLAWNVRLQMDLNHLRKVETIVITDPQPSPLKPQGSSARAVSAYMYMQRDGKGAVLVIENLEPAPPGKVYQIWVADEVRQQPMEVFQVARNLEQVVMQASEPLTKFKWVMITVENAADSPKRSKPSETTVLLGDL